MISYRLRPVQLINFLYKKNGFPKHSNVLSICTCNKLIWLIQWIKYTSGHSVKLSKRVAYLLTQFVVCSVHTLSLNVKCPMLTLNRYDKSNGCRARQLWKHFFYICITFNFIFLYHRHESFVSFCCQFFFAQILTSGAVSVMVHPMPFKLLNYSKYVNGGNIFRWKYLQVQETASF